MSEQDFSFEGEPQPSSGGSSAPSGDTGRSTVPPGYVPHHVVGDLRRQLREREEQLNGWKEFGDPKSVKEQMARLQELAKDRKFTPKELEELGREMEAVKPEWAGVIKEIVTERQARRESTAAAGEAKVGKWLKELNVPEDNKYAAHILQETIVGVITHPDHRDLFKRLYFGHDATVFDDAYAIVKKTFGLGAAQRKDAAGIITKKTALSRPPVQAKPNAGEPEKPKSDREKLAEDHEKAFELIGQFEE